MPEYTVVPENIAEWESREGMIVERNRVMGFTANGRPILQVAQMNFFSDPKKAFEWVMESPESLYKFKVPVAGARLSGMVVNDPETSRDVLILSDDIKTGMSPVIIKSLYRVVTDNQSFFRIDMLVDRDQEGIFDEDLVSLYLPNGNQPPTLNFSLNPWFKTVDDLGDEMTKMSKRVNIILDKLLDGLYSNPRE